MDHSEAHLLRLMDVRQRIVDEQAFIGGPANSVEQDLKDLRVRLDMTHLSGNDHVIEQVEEVESLAYRWKRLGGPVAQSIYRVARLFHLFQYFDGTGEGFADRIPPIVVIRLYQM